MEKKLDKAELDHQLHSREDAIALRLQAIQDEVVTAPEALRAWAEKKPLVAAGSVALGGLAVGLLLGRRRKTPTFGGFSEKDVRAMQGALGGQTPVVLYSGEPHTASSGSAVGDLVRLVLRMAMGLAVQGGIGALVTRLGVPMPGPMPGPMPSQEMNPAAYRPAPPPPGAGRTPGAPSPEAYAGPRPPEAGL